MLGLDHVLSVEYQQHYLHSAQQTEYFAHG